jgi:cytoplasmic iron level regulating protein YaaA (DUF328/UPF0246 family)
MAKQTNYSILLPPSEGKNSNSTNDKYSIVKTNKNYNYFTELDTLRYQISSNLQDTLNSKSIEKQEKILDLKGKNLEYAKKITLNFENELTTPVINRYDGVMFKSINYNGMSKLQKENFNNSVIFIDGMFGLLKPQDLIPDYKLKITSKFDTFRMTPFWKENLYSKFNDLFKSAEIIIDILPGAHRKIVNFSNANQYVEIMFAKIDTKTKKLKNVGHESKVLKGEIINFIVKHDIITVDNLKSWEHSSGYSYNTKLSNKHLILYLKD